MSNAAAETTDDPGIQRAEAAFRRILGGDAAGGLADYARVLAGNVGFRLSIGMHLALLRQMGHADAAATLERIGLECGCDLLVAVTAAQKAPERRISAYREFFSRGLYNSTMLNGYAEALSEAGNSAALGDLMNRRLLHISRPDWTAEDGTGCPLHVALDEALDGLRGAAVWQEQYISLFSMLMLNKVLEIDHPAIRQLTRLLRGEVDRAIAGFCGFDPCHRLPERAHTFRRFGSWALYSDADGYNIPHIHSKGILTGVYYVATEYGEGADGHDGALRFQHGVDGRTDCPGWPDLTVPTTPGMLVIMPSYFTHYRLPLDRPSRRVCLVFDVEFSADCSLAGPAAPR